jgi:hypothetical protein
MGTGYVCGGPVIPTRFGGNDPRDDYTLPDPAELAAAKKMYDQWVDRWIVDIEDTPENWFELYHSAGLDHIRDGEIFLGLALSAALIKLSRLEDRDALAERHRQHTEEYNQWLRGKGWNV